MFYVFILLGYLHPRDVLAYIANNQIKLVVSDQEKPINDIPVIQTVSSVATFTDITSLNMGNAFAQRLSESKLSVPHQYIRATTRINRLNELRTELKVDSDVDFSINDFIIKACALGLRVSLFLCLISNIYIYKLNPISCRICYITFFLSY